MDKPENEKPIKIKINGKDSYINESQSKAPSSKQKKEPLINQQLSSTESREQSAATKEKNEDGEKFDWILPSGTALPKEDSNIIYLKDKKKEKLVKPLTALLNKKAPADKVSSKIKTPKNGMKGFKNFKGLKNINSKMLLSIVFAVIIGTFFGLILLKLVPANQAVGEDQTMPVNEQTEELPVTSGSIEAVIAPLSAVVVQEGIYSSQSAAEEVLARVKETGIPAEIVSMDGKYAIFVSVADSIGDAKTIGKELEGNGLTTFSKEVTIDEKTISLKHEEEKTLLELSPKLYKALTASATSAGISNNIPEATMKNVDNEAAILSEIKKEELEHQGVLEVYTVLEAAVEQLKEYDKNADSNSLNLLQQSLLSFLASYQSLK